MVGVVDLITHYWFKYTSTFLYSVTLDANRRIKQDTNFYQLTVGRKNKIKIFRRESRENDSVKANPIKLFVETKYVRRKKD